MGYRVIGVDLSPLLIERAKEIAKSGQVSHVTFQVGDVRSILQLLDAHSGTFDAVISMYTSIGYYDEATDCSVFRQLRQLVTENGVLVIETMNRDFIVKHHVYSVHELIASLTQSGWDFVNAFSTLDLAEPVTPNRPRMLIVSRRSADA